MITKKRTIIIIVSIVTAVAILTAVILTAGIRLLRHYNLILPNGINWVNRQVDIKDDDLSVRLYNKKVTVYKDGVEVFESLKSYRVQDFVTCDINRDGRDELILLCFKRGKYGKHRPMWVKRDEIRWSQHIYIYGFDETKQEIRPVWMASEIGFDVKSIKKQDNYIVLTDTEGKTSLWGWISWGLSRID